LLWWYYAVTEISPAACFASISPRSRPRASQAVRIKNTEDPTSSAEATAAAARPGNHGSNQKLLSARQAAAHLCKAPEALDTATMGTKPQLSDFE
jgi:hypothetical protein